MTPQPVSNIQFGDYLDVTDLGGGSIRVDGCPPGGGTGLDVVQSQVYGVCTTSVPADGSGHELIWGSSAGDPLTTVVGGAFSGTRLQIVDDGFYIVVISLLSNGWADGKVLNGYLMVGFGQQYFMGVGQPSVQMQTGRASANKCSAGDQIAIAVYNHDTVSRDVMINEVRIHKLIPSAPVGGGGSGIQFDTYPQAGNWLYAETGDPTGSPNGEGIELKDGGGGIKIWTTTASGSDIDISAGDGTGGPGTGQLHLVSDNETTIIANDQLTLWSESNIIQHVAGTWNIHTYGSTVWTADSNVVLTLDGDFALKFQFGVESFSVWDPSGPTIKTRLYSDGRIYAVGLPTSAGASGTLYVDASGFVKRA